MNITYSRLPRPRSISDAYAVAAHPVLDFLAPAWHYSSSKSIYGDRWYNYSTTRLRNRYDCSKRSLRNPSSRDFRTSPHQDPQPSYASRRQRVALNSFDQATLPKPHRGGLVVALFERHLERRRFGYIKSYTGAPGTRRLKSDKIQKGRAPPGTDSYAEGTRLYDATKQNPRSLSGGNHVEKAFTAGSRLPPEFLDDTRTLKSLISEQLPSTEEEQSLQRDIEPTSTQRNHIDEHFKLLDSVRELEDKLAKARQQLKTSLHKSTSTRTASRLNGANVLTRPTATPVLLTKEDYLNLVDLYYHSYNDRFSPESTDSSPTPSFLNDYSFQLSEDFSKGYEPQRALPEDEGYESPLKHIHEMLKSRQLKEVADMQIFVDLLLDDASSNKALYDAYKSLPDPGVAYLPQGIIRFFLQKMSTPWTHSEKSMLRYLSLIDDMQRTQLPLTVGEWSSAVYLAGRSFAKVTDSDVNSAFKIWRNMEHEAGIQSSHVTFNILFDIAVRAGKFALGQTVLREMHKRNLRLNRLGRVSLMYYHGLCKDGDGVRKAYRDFVEAGEIVDTLVLNCVIAALMNADEPAAAEQVYGRMKSMQERLSKEVQGDGTESFFMRYPPPGDSTINQEMASNHLGRVLEKAKHLRDVLPERHADLQARMPLTPNFITFRTMLAYHCTRTGDLDRISVLLNEMTEMFGIPLRTMTFQHLFKGFAIHGPQGGPDTRWSVKRLDMCWAACRDAIKRSQKAMQADLHAREEDNVGSSSEEPTLPSVRVINAIHPHEPLPAFVPVLRNPPPRRLSSWDDFVLDLASFPQSRAKRIERFHAQMFDKEEVAARGTHEEAPKHMFHTFSDPFFQSVVYHAPEEKLDREEGEYVLPRPTDTSLLEPGARLQTEDGTEDMTTERQRPNEYESPEHDDAEDRSWVRSQVSQGESSMEPRVSPTRLLICWLLRAYARNTRSRSKVEEIYSSVRKLWRPQDALQRDSVVRVLRRCLRDCDREGSG